MFLFYLFLGIKVSQDIKVFIFYHYKINKCEIMYSNVFMDSELNINMK